MLGVPKGPSDLGTQPVRRKVEAKQSGYERLERTTVYNQLGVTARAAHRLEASERWLRRSISDTGAEQRAKTVARLELGKTLDLLGRRSEAMELYRTVRAAEDFAGSRREAERLLRGPFTAQLK